MIPPIQFKAYRCVSAKTSVDDKHVEYALEPARGRCGMFDSLVVEKPEGTFQVGEVYDVLFFKRGK